STERWPSGRRRSPAKRVRGVLAPSRVQIPPSPLRWCSPVVGELFTKLPSRRIPGHPDLAITVQGHERTLELDPRGLFWTQGVLAGRASTPCWGGEVIGCGVGLGPGVGWLFAPSRASRHVTPRAFCRCPLPVALV